MSKNIQRVCKWCDKEFLADIREINRGGGKFCSLSCGAYYNNLHKTLITKICHYCEQSYQTQAKRSLYCTRSCSEKARKARTVKAGNQNTNRSLLQKRIIKKLGPKEFKCFICEWNEVMCDIHHIIAKSKGGSDNFDNLTVLCPNHHRLADRNKLISMPSVSERYRTIFSSDI